MPHRILEYPEAVGKIVEEVTFTKEEDFHMITIRFTDKTALGFHIKIQS